jgi:phosphate-selective porin
VKHVDFQVEYELGVHEWRDVYLDYRQFKVAQVRGGIFKVPFGLDEHTSATSLDFIYRSRISSRLAPGRDRGVSLHGRVVKNIVRYEAGVFGNDGDKARPSNSARVFGKTTVAAHRSSGWRDNSRRRPPPRVRSPISITRCSARVRTAWSRQCRS